MRRSEVQQLAFFEVKRSRCDREDSDLLNAKSSLIDGERPGRTKAVRSVFSYGKLRVSDSCQDKNGTLLRIHVI